MLHDILQLENCDLLTIIFLLFLDYFIYVLFLTILLFLFDKEYSTKWYNVKEKCKILSLMENFIYGRIGLTIAFQIEKPLVSVQDQGGRE
ncbi:hypothetical protein N752_09830 [Desulforamulus aquiferis]|nr:hypothetical protein N752_09830 [Desulforamulus aquiferis]